MASETSSFDGASGQFLDHYNQVRGHVREEVTRHNLVSLLPASGALEVLDFGGGAGRDALWLAEMEKGDRVVLLDESPEMLGHAVDRFKQAKASVKTHLTVVQGGLEELPGDQEFDVILSHGVLMYNLDDPQAEIDALAARLRQRGILSLLTKGYEAARHKVPPEHLEEFEATSQYPNKLELMRRAHRFSELESMAAQAGLETIARFGVRILSDDDERPFKEIPPAELEGILEREKAASRDPDQMEQAQLLHVIARKI